MAFALPPPRGPSPIAALAAAASALAGVCSPPHAAGLIGAALLILLGVVTGAFDPAKGPRR